MKLRLLATRYAQALFQRAEAVHEVAAAQSDLNHLDRLFQHQPKFHQLLFHPSIPVDEKRRILTKACASLESTTVLPFLMVLIRKGRIPLLAMIRDAFDKRYRDYEKRVRVTIRSAVPLSNLERQRLEAALHRRTGGGQLEIREVVDPELIGGMTIHYGDLLLDGSMRTRIRLMNERLLRLNRNMFSGVDLGELPELAATEGDKNPQPRSGPPA